jgi:hypothetical protein
MKLINTLNGLYLMLWFTKIFHPEKILKGKRVAVIGAADSAFENKNGNDINSYDYIIRVNKAIHSLTPEKEEFIGNRTDILFHSFFENNDSGGGTIDTELFSQAGVKYIVNPHHNLKGLKTHLNYYKRNLKGNKTFILPKAFYNRMTEPFQDWVPTVGYTVLYTLLHSDCKEIYISGFTFFKTPYANDYRDHLKDMEVNEKHIEQQGLHNPDLELNEFIKNLIKEQNTGRKILMDSSLKDIVNNHMKIIHEKG